jgi:hypothetical protein
MKNVKESQYSPPQLCAATKFAREFGVQSTVLGNSGARVMKFADFPAGHSQGMRTGEIAPSRGGPGTGRQAAGGD